MDFLYLFLLAALWGVIALLVRGLERLAPSQEPRK